MTDSITLLHADTEAQLLACYDVMRELRPQLRSAQDLLAAVATQRPQGYRILAAWNGDAVIALAGYRQLDNLIHGRFLYVDDLVSRPDQRGRGHGDRLLTELRELGRADGCHQLVLDTGLANSLAQRFYFRAGFLAQGLHFSMVLR